MRHSEVEKSGFTESLEGVSQLWGRKTLRDNFPEVNESKPYMREEGGEKMALFLQFANRR